LSKLVHATLEPNDANTDGDAVTLYYEGEPPTAEVVAQDLCTNPLAKKLPLTADTTHPYFNVVLSTAPHASGLVRVQAHPTC
jgi:hypothetical protein